MCPRIRWWAGLMGLWALLGLLQPVSGIGYAEEPTPEQIASYRIGPGDRIAIRVFGESELSLESVIGQSGVISYPFLGEIKVAGNTPTGLERELTVKLGDGYLVNPEVTVSVIEYRPFFLDGYVKRPGSYPYQPGLTVRKAITLAGGFSERASKDKISVVHNEDASGRRLENPAQTSIGLDEPVRPGDVITVGRSFF